jgi:hypothetical protein
MRGNLAFPQLKNLVNMLAIDLEVIPEIYRTNNPKHYGKLCIDFYPEHTLTSFNNILEVKAELLELFGEEQCKKWFPNPIIETAEDGKVLGVMDFSN